MSESSLVTAIRLDLGAEPDLVLWRHNTGVLLDQRGIPIRFGLGVGGPDLLGVLGPHGTMIGLEVKTTTGRVSAAQVTWHELARQHGALVYVVRSVDEARAALALARDIVRERTTV